MTERATAAIAVALALAVAVAGCGGSSESMRKLRAQATRICTGALAQQARIQPPPVPAATTAFLRRGIAALRPELAQLRKLRPPSERARTYAAALGSLARALTILTATVHDLDRGADPLTTIKTLEHRLAPVEANGNAAWRTLDVPACVNR